MSSTTAGMCLALAETGPLLTNRAQHVDASVPCSGRVRERTPSAAEFRFEPADPDPSPDQPAVRQIVQCRTFPCEAAAGGAFGNTNDAWCRAAPRSVPARETHVWSTPGHRTARARKCLRGTMMCALNPYVAKRPIASARNRNMPANQRRRRCSRHAANGIPDLQPPSLFSPYQR